MFQIAEEMLEHDLLIVFMVPKGQLVWLVLIPDRV